jgi:alkylation response protein AidB-like acyl-CoA dehydrogenase
VCERGVADPATRGALVADREASHLSLERIATMVDAGTTDNDTLAAALMVRYAAQRAVRDVTAQSVGLLGGMAFIGSPDVSYLASAASAFQFHPPSQHAGTAAIDTWSDGGVLRVD